MKRIVLLLAIVAAAVACGDKSKKATVEAGDWTEDAVIYELNIRQATAEGTLKAAEAKLPELKELGAERAVKALSAHITQSRTTAT